MSNGFLVFDESGALKFQIPVDSLFDPFGSNLGDPEIPYSLHHLFESLRAQGQPQE